MSARARAARPDASPDAPRGFGPRCTWLAVRAKDPERVVAALALRTVLPANWRAGLTEIAECGVFVTPTVEGWVFAVGPDLRGPVGGEAEFVAPLLERLSATFGDAAWFTTHDLHEQHGWAFAVRGSLQRGYAFDGEAGHVFWHGDVTDAEREIDCFVDDPRDGSLDEIKWWPDQRIVLQLAAAWSLDPSRLAMLAMAPSAGHTGRM